MSRMKRSTRLRAEEAIKRAPKELSHGELADVLRVALRAGVLMLRSGSATFRAEQVMRRIAEAMGVERLDSYVTPTGIIASAYSGREHRTQIRTIPVLGVDMNRVVEIENLTRYFPPEPSPEYLSDKLDAIEGIGAQYPAWLTVLAVATACGALAIILGGGLLEFISAFCGAAAAQAVRLRLNRAHFNPIPVTIVGSGIATAISYALAQLSIQIAPSLASLNLGLTATPRFGVIASVLLFVPGVPLVTAVLDLTRLDLVAGTARTAYAALLLMSIGIGLLAVLTLTGFEVLGHEPAAALPDLGALPIQGVMGFLVTLGFCVLFNVPRRTLLSAATVGMVGHLVRHALRSVGVSNEVAAFCGAFFVGIYGYWDALRFNTPRLIFTVTGIISMIPGIPAFQVLVFFSQGDIAGGIQSAVQAALGVGAIAAGLAVARVLTDIEWAKIDPQ